MAKRKTINITANRQFDFPAGKVFDAWLNPEIARHWLFATPDGVMQKVEMNPVIGGSYVVVERRAEGDAEHFGQYIRINRPSLLEFTFSVDRTSKDSGRVLIELTPVEKGCKVILTHEMDARWVEYVDRTKTGWESLLEGLNRTLEKMDKARE